MPYLTRTQCNYSRCSIPVEHGRRYCPSHIKDKPGNDKQSHPWYHKASYRKQRKRFVLDNPHCNQENGHGCGRLIQRSSNRHLDHIRPWQTGSNKYAQWQLFINEDNWQVLCPSCHQRKTLKENE